MEFQGFRIILFIFLLSGILVSRAQAQRPPQNPLEMVGVESCRDCHEEMVDAWEKSDHARSFEVLAKSDKAKKIAEVLSIKPADIPTTVSCVRCHYTQETLASVAQTTEAVSCESCHGGGAGWIEEHNRKSLSRSERVDYSTRLGMAHPDSIHAITKTCYECHVVDDEQLVNMTGHPAISDDFEFLSWYSGEVKHNFLVQKAGKKTKSHTDTLQEISQTRKRMLYLAGKLHHLSHTLKAIARTKDAPVDKKGDFVRLENGRYTFGVQHALVIDQLKKDLEAVQKKTSISEFTQALVIVRGLSLKTGQSREINEAAEKVAKLAEEFCEKHDGKEFGAIDPMLKTLKPRFSKEE